MNLDNVIEICNPDKKWSLEEANSMLPLLRRLSNKCDSVVNKLLADQRYLLGCGAPKEKIENIDLEVQNELKKWGEKVVRLGCKYRNGYILFDSGYMYYSWLPTEPEIGLYQPYYDPFNMRRKLTETIK